MVDSVLSDYAINEIEIQGSINSSENLKIIKSYNPDLLISILGNQIFKDH